MKKYFYLLLFLFPLVYCCEEEMEEVDDPIVIIETIPLPEKDFIVFGSVYEECGNDCRELFLLANNHVYRDADNPREEEVRFLAEPLSAEKYEIALPVKDVPTSILTNSLSEDDMINTIADADITIFGVYEGFVFEIKFDQVDSTKKIEEYRYTEMVKEVKRAIRSAEFPE